MAQVVSGSWLLTPQTKNQNSWIPQANENGCNVTCVTETLIFPRAILLIRILWGIGAVVRNRLWIVSTVRTHILCLIHPIGIAASYIGLHLGLVLI